MKQQLSDMEAAYKELREEAEIYAEKKRKLQVRLSVSRTRRSVRLYMTVASPGLLLPCMASGLGVACNAAIGDAWHTQQKASQEVGCCTTRDARRTN